MKTSKIIYALTTVVALLILASCSKKVDEFLYKGDMLPVTITGYNGSSEELIVKIDTFTFKSLLSANSSISQNITYTFIGDKKNAKVTITEKKTGKLVLEKELNRSEKEVSISIVYIDGKIFTVDPPAADPQTNKLGLYIVNKENNNLADLILVNDNLELLTTVGKNITPNKWVYLDVDFTTTSEVQVPMFIKAGTSGAEQDGYFKDYIWSSFVGEGTNTLFSTNGTKGEVRSFIIVYSDDNGQPLAIQL